MANKKQSYLGAFLKSGYLIHALLLAALACTLVVFGYACGLWGVVLGNAKLLILTSITVGIVGLLLLVYIIASANKSKIGITDALAFALTLVSVFFLFFMIFYLDGYNTRRVLAVVVVFALGLSLVVLNACKWNPEKVDDATCVKNTIANYYKTVFSKYSFFSILCATTVCISIATLFLLPSYGFGLSKNEYVYAAILVLPLIFWVAWSASSKQVGLFDALLIALYLTAPVVLVLIILTKTNQTLNLCIWAAAVFAGLVLTFFRYLSFDLGFKPEKKEITGSSQFSIYLKKVASEYNPLLIIAIGALLAASVFLFFPVGSASRFIKITQTSISFSPILLLVLVIQITTLGTLLLSVLLPCTNLTVKKVNVADFLLLVFISFLAFGFLDVLVVFSIKKILVILAGLFFALVIAFARISKVCAKS